MDVGPIYSQLDLLTIVIKTRWIDVGHLNSELNYCPDQLYRYLQDYQRSKLKFVKVGQAVTKCSETKDDFN